MELMKRTGSSSVPALAKNMSSLSRPTDSEAMRMSSIWSLFSSRSSAETFHTKSPKAVIDWQLSKPEIISVSRLNIHYTSLRDLMLLQCDCSSTGVSESSPRAKMKNHLLEQVARAYMPLNMEKHHNKSTQFFPWNWQKLMSCTPLISFPACSSSGWFSGFNLSSALRYLVGRPTKQPVRFLKHRIC